MNDHIKARQELGIKIGILSRISGYIHMPFVPEADIKAASDNLRNGTFKYNKETNFIK
jgi:hypothetical protein